ncbi:hypothetical protein SEVIR_1G056732v4 [Setaria viridis]
MLQACLQKPRDPGGFNTAALKGWRSATDTCFCYDVFEINVSCPHGMLEEVCGWIN